MSDRNPYYTLESFTLTDILEDEEYDLRKWENVSKFVDRLNHVTGNAIRLQNENNQLNIQLKTRVIVNKQYEKIKKLEKENERLRSLHIDLLETIVKEPFYQEIFKEFLLENPNINVDD